jgi:hypothetical protein
MSSPSEPVGHRFDIGDLVVLAEPHDRALAERALDLAERGVERLGSVHGRAFDEPESGL